MDSTMPDHPREHLLPTSALADKSHDSVVFSMGPLLTSSLPSAEEKKTSDSASKVAASSAWAAGSWPALPLKELGSLAFAGIAPSNRAAMLHTTTRISRA